MKILLATDGSETSLRAARYVIGLIERLAEPGMVTLISVHDDTALRHARRFVGKEAIDGYLRDLSEKDLAQTRETLNAAAVRHDHIIRTGHVAAEIASAAEEGGFDLLVLGSKGRSAFRDLLIGSVARRIIEVSKVPVLLVP
jgi:nucleotide-binding universal stress UspA family protein